MFGFEGYGTKYYGQSDAIVVLEFSSITVSVSHIYEISVSQADIYDITISVTGGGA